VKLQKHAALACGLALALLCCPPLQACGPFLPFAVFTHLHYPGYPLEKFAAGELGVLEPSYAARTCAWPTGG